MNQDIGISGDVALLLERALPGFDARFWTRTDAYHQAYLSKEKAKGKLPELTAWADGFDPATLRHHGITSPQDNQATTVEKILQFFGVATLELELTWMQAQGVVPPEPGLHRGRAEHRALAAPDRAKRGTCHRRSLPPGSLRKAARIIPAMTNLAIPDGFTAARAALARAGVVLTFLSGESPAPESAAPPGG